MGLCACGSGRGYGGWLVRDRQPASPPLQTVATTMDNRRQSLSAYPSLTIYSLFTHYPLTTHSLPTHHPLTIHSLSTPYPLHIHSISTHYSLTVHSLSTHHRPPTTPQYSCASVHSLYHANSPEELVRARFSAHAYRLPNFILKTSTRYTFFTGLVPATSKYFQILANTYFQILPNTSKYFQLLPNTSKYFQILLILLILLYFCLIG